MDPVDIPPQKWWIYADFTIKTGFMGIYIYVYNWFNQPLLWHFDLMDANKHARLHQGSTMDQIELGTMIVVSITILGTLYYMGVSENRVYPWL